MRHFDTIFQTFHNEPSIAGDGGGGSDGPAWPDYQVPAGVGAGGENEPQDETAGPTSTGDSVIPGGEAPGESSHDGDTPPRSQDSAPPTGQPSTLPSGRLEQMLARADARYANLEKQFTQQSEIIKKLAGVFSPEQPKADPRTVALRNRLMEVMPELRSVLDLAAKSGDLTALLQRAPSLTQQEDRHWQQLASRTMSAVHDQIAPFMLGEDGATADKLSKDQKDFLVRELQRWCLTDEARVERYELGDPKLIEEFRDYYVAMHVAPSRRATVTNAVRRAAAGAAAPRAGRADATATSVPKADPSDDDATHARGWQHVSNAFAGRR